MIDETILKRRSIRKFTPRQPSKTDIERLLAAASAAPSASNKQPWRFHVVSKKQSIAALASEVEKKRQQLISLADEDFRAHFQEYSKNFVSFAHAPVIIVPSFRSVTMLSHLFSGDGVTTVFEEMKKIEYDSALISVSCAIENLLLMAEAIGLATCCTTGPLIATVQLEKYLSIPQGWSIAAVIAVGYADEKPDMPTRKSVAAISQWLL